MTETKPRGATLKLLRQLMATSPWPERTLKGTGHDARVDAPGWELSTNWLDRRFVHLHFSYYQGGVYVADREAAGLDVLRQFARWVADQGFVVYLVADRSPYALIGRIDTAPRWGRFDQPAAVERFEPA
jgi:hypothetical protein